MTDQNKSIVRHIFEETDKGNVDIVDELYADNHMFYQPGNPPMDKAAHRQLLSMYHTSFSDWHQDIQEMIAEGDRVVTRFIFKGTHTGDLMGAPPTGKQVGVEAVSIDRIVGGKIAEEWVLFDMPGMMQQLELAPSNQQVGK